jgi:ubiquinone/menaquinone biosynthesis C-methylase UbiE
MRPVNYDRVASAYDQRYARNRYDGVRACLHRFASGGHSETIAEIGCGTGYWLADLSEAGFEHLAGLDLSAGMLARARAAAPSARLVRGTAELLPFRDAAVDRAFCVNALHHFASPPAFLSECRRVLRSTGRVLTIGLDPQQGDDRWWVYDYFPGALEADRQRYPPSSAIRRWLMEAGFRDAATELAQHISAEMPLEVARERGFLDRSATSQLMVIGDDDYEAGLRRLQQDRPVLRADLRLYATIGQM